LQRSAKNSPEKINNGLKMGLEQSLEVEAQRGLTVLYCFTGSFLDFDAFSPHF